MRFAMGAERLALSAALGVCGCQLPTVPPLPPPRVQVATEPSAAIEHPLPAPRPEPAEPPTRHQRYWAPMLALDVVALYPTLSYALGKSDRPWLLAAPVLSGPLVHLVAGEPRNAAISFVLRAVVTGGGLLLARRLGSACDGPTFCLSLQQQLLVDVAIVLPMALDQTWLAIRRVPVEPPRPLPMMPSVAAVPGGATVGFVVGL